MTNYYPEKPILPYVKTAVPMGEVVAYLASLNVPVEVKRSTYVFFRIESQNGQHGINNNYGGLQADSGRWPAALDSLIVGVVKLNENQTGNPRLFLAFRDFKGSIDFTSGRLSARGIYVGGYAHKIAKMNITNKTDLARVYHKEWVKGDINAEPSKAQLNNFLSMYGQSEKLFVLA